MLSIDIASLPDGIHERTLTPQAEDLNLDPSLFENIRTDVRLNITGQQILADFTARATALLECDRTLRPFNQEVEGDFQVLFVPSPEEVDPDDAGTRPLVDGQTSIDLTEPVRDTLLLALPLRRIAPDAEGTEINTTFGREENDLADDRWEALRKLKTDD